MKLQLQMSPKINISDNKYGHWSCVRLLAHEGLHTKTLSDIPNSICGQLEEFEFSNPFPKKKAARDNRPLYPKSGDNKMEEILQMESVCTSGFLHLIEAYVWMHIAYACH